MGALGRDKVLLAVIGVGMVGVLLAAQFAASASLDSGRIDTARSLGRAGFAYLGGIRTFAAALLWNRLDPQYHEYYEGKPLSQQDFYFPTFRLVIALDPQFEQAYYEAAFRVYQHGKKKTGLDIARQGIENNPDSGLLRANLVQLLILNRDPQDLEEAVKQARIGVGKEYRTLQDQYESFAIFRAAFRLAGDEAAVEEMNSLLREMEERGATVSVGDHDHDGDGVPDH